MAEFFRRPEGRGFLRWFNILVHNGFQMDVFILVQELRGGVAAVGKELGWGWGFVMLQTQALA